MHRSALRLTAAALALVCGASVMQAQTPGSFGVAGGLSLPMSDLGNTTESGYYVGAVFDISPPLSPVGFRVDGFLNNLSGEGSRADYRTIGATGALTIGMGGIGVKPYLLGGAGIYNSKIDVSGAEGKTSAGLNFGIGAKFGLTGFSTYAEARVHYMFQKQDAITVGGTTVGGGYNKAIFVPITFGILF